jgi:hypothetical protein
MTIDDDVEQVVKDLKKAGINVIAYGTADELVKLQKEKKFSKKTQEDSQ